MPPESIRRYLVPVHGCVEPELEGPFEDDEERLERAREIHAEQDQDDALFWLDIPSDGEPVIGAFAGGDFKEDQ